MDKQTKERGKRMLEHNVNHDSTRPLRQIIVHKSCGCTSEIGSDPLIAPREGLPVWCFTHGTVLVGRVEWLR